jgi:hypothetical protein
MLAAAKTVFVFIGMAVFVILVVVDWLLRDR